MVPPFHLTNHIGIGDTRYMDIDKVLLEAATIDNFTVVQCQDHMYVLCPNCACEVMEESDDDIVQCSDCNVIADWPQLAGHPNYREGEMIKPSDYLHISATQAPGVYEWWLEAWTGHKIERVEVS